jgi:hypothetical protein
VCARVCMCLVDISRELAGAARSSIETVDLDRGSSLARPLIEHISPSPLYFLSVV